MITEGDRNKIEVGKYLIAKATPTGPTYSNTQYKALEFESKGKDFLNAGSQPKGLYMKVKTDGALFTEATTFSFNGVRGTGGSQVYKEDIPLDGI